jgi:uncharacterized protein YbbK (DUF523 family)
METDHPALSRPGSTRAGTAQASIRIGVSACLLGEPVRYDGAHQRDPYVCEELARLVRLVPICPEVEIGLGVPRRPIRLVRTERGVRVRDAREPDDPRLDLTQDFQALADALAPLLGGLHGYVLKSGSPSCGLWDVKLYDGAGGPRSVTTGAFARLVTARYPGLPVIDERQLADPAQRRRFLQQVGARGE